MHANDYRGCAVSGATPSALAAFERALECHQSWRANPAPWVDEAIRIAPRFAMAHTLRTYMLVCGREPDKYRRARESMAPLKDCRLNSRETLHLKSIEELMAGRLEDAAGVLVGILREYPRDILALQVLHTLDHLTGNASGLRDRCLDILPHWSRSIPGYLAVAAMLAFGYIECGQYSLAMAWSERALEADPACPRLHHVMAHHYEMTERFESGSKWMTRTAAQWVDSPAVATHCWWHTALFELRQQHHHAALCLYDQRVRPDRSQSMGDHIDASSLLWTMHLSNVDVGERWSELADAWAPHAADGFCAFNDMHAAMAFVAAGRWPSAAEQIGTQTRRAQVSDTNGTMTRLVGLPACRALIAFGRGRYEEAFTLLSTLPAIAHRLGGSQAQRHILALTRDKACQQMRPSRSSARASEALAL